MGKRLIFFFLVLCIVTSCSSMSSMINADKNIRKVQLGMSKKDVVSIMGKDFRVLGATADKDGNFETIGYDNANEELYVLVFSDGRLVNYELTRPHKHPPHHNRERPHH